MILIVKALIAIAIYFSFQSMKALFLAELPQAILKEAFKIVVLIYAIIVI